MDSKANDIILVGGGANCKVIIDLLSETSFNPIGILDPNLEKGSMFQGLSVLGTDDDAADIFESGVRKAVITIAMPCSLKKRLAEQYSKIGFAFPTLISDSAIIAPSAKIGAGTCVMPGANIGPDTIIGDQCTINVSSVVTHGITIDDYCNIAPNSTILGFVSVGESSLIGANSVIVQCNNVGHDCIVGAGAVVLKDVEDGAVMVGNPAKVLRKAEH